MVKKSRYFIGQRIIGTENYEKKIFNSCWYYIHDIDNEEKLAVSKTLNGEPITDKNNNIKYFSNGLFDNSYCVTVYRYQGGTCRHPYNIYNMDKMNFGKAYTTLSHGTKQEHINLCYSDKVFKPLKEKNESTSIDTTPYKKDHI